MLTEFELVNISPEIGTKRALETVKLYSLPEDTCVIFFHHFETITKKKKGSQTDTKTVKIHKELGWYYIKDGKTHVGGYIPCMLDYLSINGSVVRIVWSDVTNVAKAHQRFLLLLGKFKKKYGQSELRTIKR